MTWPTTVPTDANYDAGTDNPQLARTELVALFQHVVDMINARGIADGVASLDAGAKVPAAQLPDIGFPSGTKMLFYQAAAPTGWVQDVTVNDKVLRVVSGDGAGSGGSWTISGLTAGNVGSTALTVSQIPSHTHSYNQRAASIGVDNQAYGLEGFWTMNPGTTAKTSGPSGSGATHAHSGSTISADGNWRPAYIDVIAASKS